MNFIDTYKQLEKLCEDMFQSDKKVTAYIEAMQNTSDGELYVKTWREDLKKLKHLRWVRNKIVHEPGCTEENMCEPGDKEWLEDFYKRILKGNDPLAVYESTRHKARQQMYADSGSHIHSAEEPNPHHLPGRQKLSKYNIEKSNQNDHGCLTGFLIFLGIIAFVIGSVLLVTGLL